MSEAVLDVRGLKVGYGDGRRIVDGVDLQVEPGEIVTMIGQNGAGKSTVLKGIYNMARERHGEVRLAGEPVFELAPHKLLQRGLAYIPQDHTVFPKLSIAENLAMGGYLIRDRNLLAERIAGVEAMFPVLAERRQQYAASLSGGEQRMLEIARTLVMDPKVIMLDEPSIGLAPRMVDQVFAIVRRLAQAGTAILMVEQNVKKALAASDRACVLELGRVSLQDRAQALIGDERVARLYMGMAGGGE
jgi:branched-chain amino acid transport system ATP-binding protein